MAISPLPEGTVRQLGSTLVITSPDLLLKELLDNAIDSGATSVDVLVSPNTVDKIEVRDNGHGICPSDFDCLGRPGHTSKLRSVDELDTLGGATLGFRGTALASANALASVSLTTRVPTEPVATVISLAKGGGIGTQRHVGAPVGTTVSVTGLFSHLPVRLQLAVKEAPKSLVKMKDLLQSYALTRPGVRLRFTVMKAPSLSWSYAPAPNGGVKEAAMQLFGTQFASQCTLRVFPSQTTRDGDGQLLAEQGPIFEALLPRPEADPRKIAKGAFLSVDARPISSTRGTGKRLVSTFRRHLADYFSRARSDDPPKDPFIKLNIRCPQGSYDVNVEPSKENVLFKDEQRILDEFGSFLSSIYAVSERRHSPQPYNSAEATRDAESSSGVAPELSANRLALQVGRCRDTSPRTLLKLSRLQPRCGE
jgi:DNA mismatch repair protein MutL